MDQNFWANTGKKIIETFISVKVLTIIALLAISTKFVLLHLMTGGEWAAVNGGVISTVYALREGFKISKIKSKDNSEDLKV